MSVSFLCLLVAADPPAAPPPRKRLRGDVLVLLPLVTVVPHAAPSSRKRLQSRVRKLPCVRCRGGLSDEFGSSLDLTGAVTAGLPCILFAAPHLPRWLLRCCGCRFRRRKPPSASSGAVMAPRTKSLIRSSCVAKRPNQLQTVAITSLAMRPRRRLRSLFSRRWRRRPPASPCNSCCAAMVIHLSDLNL